MSDFVRHWNEPPPSPLPRLSMSEQEALHRLRYHFSRRYDWYHRQFTRIALRDIRFARAIEPRSALFRRGYGTDMPLPPDEGGEQ